MCNDAASESGEGMTGAFRLAAFYFLFCKLLLAEQLAAGNIQMAASDDLA
jgi:hypothetical protein